MTVKLINDIEYSVYSILEPHASYIRRGPEDTDLHYVPPHVLEVLTWILMHILVPIMTGITTSVVAERLRKKGDKELSAMNVEERELEHLKTEVQQMMAQMKKEARPNDEPALIAKPSLVHILKINGWPSDIAEQDSERILHEVSGHIWSQKS